MSVPRTHHASTLLSDGRLIVTGGQNENGYLASAEIFDSTTNSWTGVASMSEARVGHAAALTGDGRVLVAGGFNGAGYDTTTEIYDPLSNLWSSAGNMSTPRYGASATRLQTNKILVIGGSFFGPTGSVTLASAESYDPSANSWTAVSSMSTPRYGSTTTLLPDGRVLVAGGQNGSQYLSTAEIYDPTLDSWSSAGNMSTARFSHTATLLDDGRVMVAGGFLSAPGVSTYLSSVEFYDRTSNTWSSGPPLATARAFHTASRLPSGRILVAGGASTSGTAIQSSELFDGGANAWLAAGNLNDGRDFQTTDLLASGKLITTGGSGPLSSLASSELFDETASGSAMAAPTHGYLGFLFHQRLAAPNDCLDVSNPARSHQGIDIWTNPQGDGTVAGSPMGNEVVAALDGKIIGIFDADNASSVRRDGTPSASASILVLDDGIVLGQHIFTLYAHMGNANRNGTFIDPSLHLNDHVSKGQSIGHQGNAHGTASNNSRVNGHFVTHLHFEVKTSARAGHDIDPSLFLGEQLNRCLAGYRLFGTAFP
jgi:N-acetylneuraminic acid mutarotase